MPGLNQTCASTKIDPGETVDGPPMPGPVAVMPLTMTSRTIPAEHALLELVSHTKTVNVSVPMEVGVKEPVTGVLPVAGLSYQLPSWQAWALVITLLLQT